MSEEQGTLIQSDDTSQSEPAQSGDLVSTVDLAIPEEQPSEETKTTEEPGGGDKEQGEEKEVEKSKTDTKVEDTRLDKHPRFKELITSNRAMKEQIAQQAEQIEALQRIPQERKPEYEDFGVKSNEQLTEMFEEDLRGFLQNFAKQVRDEVRTDVLSDVQREIYANKEAEHLKAIEATYNQYASENPRFNDMWDSGDIERFMDANPGHNAISAYMVLTKEAEMQAAIDEAVAKAVKEAEAKTAKSQQAKKKAQVLDSAPSTTGYAVKQVPAELKDTKKFGGLAAVLTTRSLARSKRASQ